MGVFDPAAVRFASRRSALSAVPTPGPPVPPLTPEQWQLVESAVREAHAKGYARGLADGEKRVHEGLAAVGKALGPRGLAGLPGLDLGRLDTLAGGR